MADWINYGIIVGILTIISIGILLAGIEQAKEKSPFIWILLLGAIGWTVAFYLRVPLIQYIQIQIITFLGGDYTDPASLALFAKDWRLLIWGPLFAGLFEEGFRFLVYKMYKKSDLNPKESPLIGGLGWAFAEFILLIFIPLWGIEIIGTFSAFLSIWERIISLTFHIIMSYIIFYACRDPRPGKRLLWLAMILHCLLDMTIVIFIVFLSDFATQNPIAYYILLECTFTLITIVCFIIIKQKINTEWKNYPSRYSEKVFTQNKQGDIPSSKDELKAQIKIDEF